ncbi:hypothetical protein ACQ4LE_005739 [Meloidogyne hapla]
MEPQCILNYSVGLGKRAKKLAIEWDIEIPENLLNDVEERENYLGENNENSSKDKELKGDNESEEDIYDYSRAIIPYKEQMKLPKIEEEKEEEEIKEDERMEEIKKEEETKEVEEIKKDEKNEKEEKEEEKEIPKRYRTRTRFTIRNNTRQVTVQFSHEIKTEISDEEKESKEIKTEKEKENAENENNSKIDSKSEDDKSKIMVEDLKEENRKETIKVPESVETSKKEEQKSEEKIQEKENPKENSKEEKIEEVSQNPEMLESVKSMEKVQPKQNSIENKDIKKEKSSSENKQENHIKKEPIIENPVNKQKETPRKITGGNPSLFKNILSKWNKNPEIKQIIENPKENVHNNPNNVKNDEIKIPLNHQEIKEIPLKIQPETKQIVENPKENVQHHPNNILKEEIKPPLNNQENKEKLSVVENKNVPNNQEIKQIPPPKGGIVPKENKINPNKLGINPKGKKQKRKNAKKGKGKKRKNKNNKKNKKKNGKKGGKPSRKRRNKNRRKNKKQNPVNKPLHEVKNAQDLKKAQGHPNDQKKQVENQPKPAEQNPTVSKAIVPYVAKNNIPKAHIPNGQNNASTPPNNQNSRPPLSPLGRQGKNGFPLHPPSGNRKQPNNNKGQQKSKQNFKGAHPGPSIFSIKHEFRPDGSVRIHTKINFGANPFAKGSKHQNGRKRVKRDVNQFEANKVFNNDNFGKEEKMNEKQNNQQKCLNVNVCETYKFLDLSAITWWWCRDVEKDNALEIVKNIKTLIEDIECIEANNCKEEEARNKAEQRVEQFYEKIFVASGIDETSQNGDYKNSECLMKLANSLIEKKKEICERFMEEKDDNEQIEFNEGLDEEEKEEFSKLCSSNSK